MKIEHSFFSRPFWYSCVVCVFLGFFSFFDTHFAFDSRYFLWFFKACLCFFVFYFITFVSVKSVLNKKQDRKTGLISFLVGSISLLSYTLYFVYDPLKSNFFHERGNSSFVVFMLVLSMSISFLYLLISLFVWKKKYIPRKVKFLYYSVIFFYLFSIMNSKKNTFEHLLERPVILVFTHKESYYKIDSFELFPVIHEELSNSVANISFWAPHLFSSFLFGLTPSQTAYFSQREEDFSHVWGFVPKVPSSRLFIPSKHSFSYLPLAVDSCVADSFLDRLYAPLFSILPLSISSFLMPEVSCSENLFSIKNRVYFLLNNMKIEGTQKDTWILPVESSFQEKWALEILNFYQTSPVTKRITFLLLDKDESKIKTFLYPPQSSFLALKQQNTLLSTGQLYDILIKEDISSSFYKEKIDTREDISLYQRALLTKRYWGCSWRENYGILTAEWEQSFEGTLVNQQLPCYLKVAEVSYVTFPILDSKEMCQKKGEEFFNDLILKHPAFLGSLNSKCSLILEEGN